MQATRDSFPNARATALCMLVSLAAASPAHADNEVRDVLVWFADESGCPETVWLREADNGIEQLAAAREVVIAHGVELWTFRTADTPIELSNCGCGELSFTGEPCPPGREVVRQSIQLPYRVELTTGQGRGRALDEGGADSGQGDYSISRTILGSAGPYLFANRCEYAYGCGAAHGGWGCAFEVIDLRTHTPVDLLSAAERKGLLGSERRIARAQLHRPDDDGDEQPEAELTAFGPRWRDGRIAMAWQYTRDDYFAISDGRWSAYTTSTDVVSGRVPARLAEDAPVPAAVVWKLDSRRPDGSVGWSVVEGDANSIAAALSAFRRSAVTECGDGAVPATRRPEPTGPESAVHDYYRHLAARDAQSAHRHFAIGNRSFDAWKSTFFETAGCAAVHHTHVVHRTGTDATVWVDLCVEDRSTSTVDRWTGTVDVRELEPGRWAMTRWQIRKAGVCEADCRLVR